MEPARQNTLLEHTAATISKRSSAFFSPFFCLPLLLFRTIGYAAEAAFNLTGIRLPVAGWRPSSLNTGDIIEIEGSPDRTKAQEMYLQRIVFPDGKEWRRDEVAR